MASNTFQDFQLLNAADLNAAFSNKLDLSTTAQQNVMGAITAPTLNLSIGLTTQAIALSGDFTSTSTSGIQMPSGTTLQRPSSTSVGWLRLNTDSGLLEALLPSGRWVNLATTAATQTPATAPAQMGAVTFGAASSTSIPLSWQPPVGGTPPFVYSVQYRLAGTSTWLPWITDVAATSTTISGLLPASRYEFQVSVKNTAGTATSPAVATNTLGFAAGGPTNVLTSQATSTSLTVSWNQVPAVSGVPVAYIVQYQQANVTSTTWKQFGTAGYATAQVITGLNSNTLYNFQVLAKTSGGTYESLVAQGTTTIAATVLPAAVGSLTFASITYNSLTIAFSQPTAGTPPYLYQLQYQPQGTSTWMNLGQPSVLTSINATNLNSGTVYSFRIATTNSMGTSFSQPYPVTMQQQAMTLGAVSNWQISGTAYPILMGPQTGEVTAQAAIDLTGITITDPVAGYTAGTLTLNVRCGTGSVTMTDATGNQITGSGTNAIPSFATTLSGVIAALRSLSYTAGANATTDSVTITVTDQTFQTSTLTIGVVVVAGISVTPTPTPTTTPSPTPTPTPTPVITNGKTATGQPSNVSGVQADRVSSFINNIGVGTSFSSPYYGPDFSPTTASVIENTLGFFPGLAFVKESGLLDNSSEGPFLQQIAANTGIKYFFEIQSSANSRSNNFTTWSNALNNIGQFATYYPGLLLGVQGVNTSAFVTNGNITDSYSYNQAVGFQPNVYATAHQYGAAAIQCELTVPATKIIGTTDYSLVDLFPDTTPAAGYATSNPLGALGDSLLNGYTASPNVPAFTQFGYSSYPDDASTHITGNNIVDETTQAKYLLSCLLDTYLYNSVIGTPAKTAYRCWYNLFDTPYSTLGLFTGYGGPPKKSGQILAAMLQDLRDPFATARTFVPGYLNYTIQFGSPAPTQFGVFTQTGFRHALFQVSTGDFWLMLANEQPLNTQFTDSEINVPSVPVTIFFNEGPVQIATLDFFNLNQSLTASSITISLPPYPIFLRITL